MSGGSAVPGERARWKARPAVPWIALLVVVSSMAYGLNLFAAGLPPTASAVSVPQTTLDHVQDDAALLDEAVFEKRAAQCDAGPWGSLCL